MNFNFPLAGNTLLGKMLSQSHPHGQYTILEMVNWYVPDSGALPAPLRHDEWGVEVIFNHPLSTIACTCSDEVFKIALDMAHTKQNKEMRFKSQGQVEFTSLADWVATGVVQSVMEFCSPQKLADLLEKISQRTDLTTALSFLRDSNDLPDPYAGLARSNQSEAQYKEKIDLVYKHVAQEGLKQYGITAPSQQKKLQKEIVKHTANNILVQAMGKGNTTLVDALAQVGKGTLGLASLTPKAVDHAVRTGKLNVLSHTLKKFPDPAAALHEMFAKNNLQAGVEEILPSLSRTAYQLHFGLFPETTKGLTLPFTIGYERHKEPEKEMRGHQEVARFALQSLVQSTSAKYLEGSSNTSLCPVFLTLPSSEVDEVYGLVEELTQRHGPFLMPSFHSWLLIGQSGPTPWLNKIQQHLEKSDEDLAAAAVDKFKQGVPRYLKECFRQEEQKDTESSLVATIRAAKCVWDTLVQAGHTSSLPTPCAMEWLDQQASTLPDEQSKLLRRLLLTKFVQEKPRENSPSMKM